MLAGYLPNALLVLCAFWGEWQSGASTTAVAVGGGLLALVLIPGEGR